MSELDDKLRLIMLQNVTALLWAGIIGEGRNPDERRAELRRVSEVSIGAIENAEGLDEVMQHRLLHLETLFWTGVAERLSLMN